MGNDVSCINSASSLLSQLPVSTAATAPYIARTRSRPLITIVNPLDGRAFRFKEPLNVGELMLDVPGHFVAEFGREQDGHMLSRRTQRISALLADTNLRALHVYYVLPMNRLNTRLATHELRKIVMATRLAPPFSAPYPAHLQASTTKITPLPSLQCEEADMGCTMKRHVSQRHPKGSHRRQPARARTYQSEPASEKVMPQREETQKVREIGGCSDDDDDDKQARLVSSTQRSMSKSRTWAPKLDTIMELAL